MGLLTLILPLIPTIVTAIEKLFGPKTGATKLDVAIKMLQQLLNSLATAGIGNGPAPSATDLAAEISKVVSILFPTGTTVDPTKGPASPAVNGAEFKAQIKTLILWALNN